MNLACRDRAPGTSGTPCRAGGSRWRTRAARCAAAGRRRRRAAGASSASGPRRRGDHRGRSAPRRCAGRAAGGCSTQLRACGRTLRGEVVQPVLQHAGARRAPEPRAAGRRARDSWGCRGTTRSTIRSVRSPCVTVTRRVDIDRPSRTRSTADVERLVGRAGLDEVRVQGVRVPCRSTVAPRGEQGLGDGLPAEDAVEAAGFG